VTTEVVVAGCVLCAVLLLVPAPAGDRRARRLVAPGTSPAPVPPPRPGQRPVPLLEPLLLDLVAAALAAGAPPADALAVVAGALETPGGPGEPPAGLRHVAERLRLGATGDAAWGTARALPGGSAAAVLRRCLELSASTGAPAAPLLRAAAADLRRRRRRSAEQAAARLGVRVVLPLGLCALPGFAAWGVVPVVVGLASTVLGG
jgi:pilus assembly protein TadC